MRKYKNKIIVCVMIAVVLAIVFWWGGSSPGLHGLEPQSVGTRISEKQSPLPTYTSAPDAKASEAPVKEADKAATTENKPQNADGTPMTASEKIALAEQMAEASQSQSEIGEDYSEENEPDRDNTEPVEPENAEASDKQLTCTLSVRCDTILEHLAWLDEEKAELVPKDGVIYAEQAVSFYEGESVFDLLVREMKHNKIHMEFENTPIYNSAYIEGIGNIYEFDCGELSGWMYSVNGQFPNYGCSRYQLKEGDRVEWVYTCNLGGDVGGANSTRNGR